MQRQTQRIGDMGSDRQTRRFDIDRHIPVQQMQRIEKTQNHIGVGDGGANAAAAITGRTGIGARALRSHAQGAAFVDPGQTAAARADFSKIDSGRTHQIAAAAQQALPDVDARAHFHFIGQARLAAFN